MEYVVIGGDERFGQLARLLREQGYDVATAFGQAAPDVPSVDIRGLREAQNAVVNYPPKLKDGGLTYEELLYELPRGARIYACGPWHPARDRRVIDLWDDEELILQNACLTAEGALASAMCASDCALRDMRCMVIGFGRIGRALTELLVAMRASVIVVTRSTANKNRAVERGAEGALVEALPEALRGCRLIYNTAPAMVLDEVALSHVDRGAMLIDLASPPYGIDLRAAWKRGLRAWREPGLPGRYCPESAARALLAAIEREKGREHA